MSEFTEAMDVFFNRRSAHSPGEKAIASVLLVQGKQISALREVVEIVAKDYEIGAGPIWSQVRNKARDALKEVERLQASA